jgi:hypothetical protein
MDLTQHPSLIAPEVYIWKKRPYGPGRGGRIIDLHDGSGAWMFWSTYWRENDARAENGDLFHIITRVNKGGTLNVANITRCNAVKDTNEVADTAIQASDLEATFEKLAVESDEETASSEVTI